MSRVPISLEAIETARQAEVEELNRLHLTDRIGPDPMDALLSAYMTLGSDEQLSDEQFVALGISYGGLHRRLRGGALDMDSKVMTRQERRIWRASLAGRGHQLAPQLVHDVEWRIAIPLLERPFTETELPHQFVGRLSLAVDISK